MIFGGRISVQVISKIEGSALGLFIMVSVKNLNIAHRPIVLRGEFSGNGLNNYI
jgi:hypothetical protein